MHLEQAIELLKRLISTPSISRDEAKAADIVEEELRALGFVPQRKMNNVWAMAAEYDAGKPTILLDAHLDTVKPNAQWVRDPFQPEVEDGKLYGLGSNDTGGSLVALLAAFVRLSKSEQPYNLIFLASAEEEVTGVNGVRAVLPELGKIDFAVVGEPTSLQPAVAEKGLLVLDCVAHGVAGHAAREEGVNAIYKALKDIEWFRTHQFERVSELLGAVKMTVTGVEAGTQHNVIPAECKFMVDVRVNECYKNVELVELIREAVECKVEPRSTHLNSSSIPLDHPAVERLVAMGKKPFGSHTADEYILLSEIEEAVELYYALLDGLKIEKQ